MLFLTEGIVLEKKPFREYDEMVFFFTKDYGKLELISFGSKSLRSKRRYFLGQLSWLQLEIELKGELAMLKDLKETFKVTYHERDYQHFMVLQELLKNATKLLPFQVVDEEIYNLMRFLTQDNIMQLPLAFKKFLFPFALLKEWNGLEKFNRCLACYLLCSDKFYYIKEKGFIGSHCLKALKPTSSPALLFSLESLFFYKEFCNNYQKKLSTITSFYGHYIKTFTESPSQVVDWKNLISLTNFFVKRYLAVNS